MPCHEEDPVWEGPVKKEHGAGVLSVVSVRMNRKGRQTGRAGKWLA